MSLQFDKRKEVREDFDKAMEGFKELGDCEDFQCSICPIQNICGLLNDTRGKLERK